MRDETLAARRDEERVREADEIAALAMMQPTEARSRLEAFTLLVAFGITPEIAAEAVRPQRGS
ncbi:MAG: hypothetical protein IT374_26085 [Polyangiaceae bacterium]|nr:hypothetical protein [Polyangiaceae bacterium]